MFSPKMNAAVLAVALSIGAGAAHATTITFDDLPASETHNLTAGASFATSGYHFSVTDGYVWLLPGAAVPGRAGNGTTSLDLGGTITVTNIGHSLFSLASLDLASVAALQTSTVKLTGIGADGSQIVQTYTIDGASSANPYALTTRYLSGFDNLSSLVMELVYGRPDQDTYFSLIDNMVLNGPAVAAVPEPATWAMLGLGLAMVAGLARRRRV
jgi:hypothetical protein